MLIKSISVVGEVDKIDYPIPQLPGNVISDFVNMSLPFPSSFNAWVSGFSDRKDIRKLKSALSKAKKKKVSEKEAWEAVAACAIVGCMNGENPSGISGELSAWAQAKGSSQELLELALEVIERLPRVYRVEAQYAVSLATVHAALASARGSSGESQERPAPVSNDLIPRTTNGNHLRDVSAGSTNKSDKPAERPSPRPFERDRLRRALKVYCLSLIHI